MDIVDRLRTPSPNIFLDFEAAEEIKGLRAERDALRAALEEIESYDDQHRDTCRRVLRGGE